MIRVGVAGVGVMGKNHARVYSKIENCQLVGVADIDFDKAKEIAQLYGAQAYRNYEELLGKVDAVSIALPTSLHKEAALKFIERGVHCLVEKPIAPSLEDAKEMVEAAEKHRVKLMVGHIERFNPAVRKLKEIVDSGKLGKLLLLSARRVGPFAPRVVDVGIIVDLATHDIDVARYLTGKEPVKVYSKYGSIKHPKEDHAILLLDFGDVAASIEVNWFTPHKVRTLVATGTEAIAYLNYIEQELEVYNAEWRMIPKIEKCEPLEIELRHFIECVEKDLRPLVDGYEGLKTLEVALKSLSPV
ncbi:MAG: gfo/Idh/MocA family oxidoreductase [Candidatus Methanomethylicota archaeon]|uniref:Gfo/Idh/MocA family oxidoreductase n=1 Tax=Thermoproteota archaeon TaxID=2056631 RepID=A0A497ER15_9CREN|nr:MAG: gfo/Idh/MocA family oxidoreductase [Candidatus Verstraetearchaeota archaeon]